MSRDDFTRSTIDILGKRVGYLCSNPECRRPTIGANENINKVTIIGIAAHITAASPRGPRYDSTINEEQRRHIENGIWLCGNCATLIDKDKKKYTVDILREWKQAAEMESQQRLASIPIPNIQLRPILEADLISKTKIRMNTGYSMKNPITMQDGFQAMDITNSPVIHWLLGWNFILTIYNNSETPAFNIKIESIGTEHFTELDKLSTINNLPPLKNIDLRAKYENRVESDYHLANQIIEKEIPKKFSKLKLKISYADTNRNTYYTDVEFRKNRICNKLY